MNLFPPCEVVQHLLRSAGDEFSTVRRVAPSGNATFHYAADSSAFQQLRRCVWRPHRFHHSSSVELMAVFTTEGHVPTFNIHYRCRSSRCRHMEWLYIGNAKCMGPSYEHGPDTWTTERLHSVDDASGESD